MMPGGIGGGDKNYLKFFNFKKYFFQSVKINLGVAVEI